LFKIKWTSEAENSFNQLKNNPFQGKRYKAVKKAIKFLAQDPRHKSLQTHEYESLRGPDGEKVFEAYAEQKTPAAYRIFWCYGPTKGFITLITITSHP